MKNAKQETLADIFLKAIEQPKDYAELVEDGAAMERLAKNPDFQRYKRLLMEAYVLLVDRLPLVTGQDLPHWQGAVSQHKMISNLDRKVLETAARIVAQEREEVEAGG